MTKMARSERVEREAISCYELNKRLALPLLDSRSVKETLEALRNTDDAGNLPGRDRLAEAQNHLVELVGYLKRRRVTPCISANAKSAGRRRS